MTPKYSIGLDLGTSSIGWSVINRDFTITKKGGKNLWGVVVFNEGKKADSRRAKRAARRRGERRKERIRLLQNLLKADVDCVDVDFYERLKNSYLMNEVIDKNTGRNYHYNLFNGEYNDKKYYKQFPTIYHLRKYLCETTEKVDIRLVYLAMHHIVKYRGNFLHDEERINVSGEGVISKLNELIIDNSNLLDAYGLSELNAAKIFNVLKDDKNTASNKAKEIKLLCQKILFKIE